MEDDIVAVNIGGAFVGFTAGVVMEAIAYRNKDAPLKNKAKGGVYGVGLIDAGRYTDLLQGPEPFYADNPGIFAGYMAGITSVNKTRKALGYDADEESISESQAHAENPDMVDDEPAYEELDLDEFEQFYDHVLSTGEIESLRCMGTSRSIQSVREVYDQVRGDDFIELIGARIEREEVNGTVTYSAALNAAYTESDAKVFGDAPALEITATLDDDSIYQELVS